MGKVILICTEWICDFLAVFGYAHTGLSRIKNCTQNSCHGFILFFARNLQQNSHQLERIFACSPQRARSGSDPCERSLPLRRQPQLKYIRYATIFLLCPPSLPFLTSRFLSLFRTPYRCQIIRLCGLLDAKLTGVYCIYVNLYSKDAGYGALDMFHTNSR